MTELDVPKLLSDYAKLEMEFDDLKESINSMKMDALGWIEVGTYDEDSGPALEWLKDTSRILRDMVASNSLMKRGAELRQGYVFGQDIRYTSLDPTVEKFILDPYNSDILFSSPGYEGLITSRVTDGNTFVIVDKSVKPNPAVYRIPLAQVTGVITDPNSAERVRYIQRSWTENGRTHKMWFTTYQWWVACGRRVVARTKRMSSGESAPVHQDAVIFHAAANQQSGWTFGVPTGFSAMVWVKAYSEYLKDNAKLVKALSMIAWNVKSTQKVAKDVAVSMASPTNGIAGTAITGGDTGISAMPRGNDVNFNNGQPIAAMVAATFGVPVIALLSSPGATGGSYGAAQTLDFPTIRSMENEQKFWGSFLSNILGYVAPKSKPPTLTFPPIESDPTYRDIQSISQAHAQGFIFQDEARDAAVVRLDIEKLHEGVPKGDGFNTYTDPNAAQNTATDDSTSSDPVPRQGNTGAVGNIASDVTDHSADNE